MKKLDKQSLPIEIRTRKPGDTGYMVFRHCVLYSQEYSLNPIFEKYVMESLLKFLSDPSGGEIWIAECGDRIIGSIGLVRIDPQTAQLRWFLIEPEFRSCGLGRKFMTTLMDFARKQGYSHIFLWTFKGLDAARHLYEQHAFTLVEEIENTSWQDHLTEQRWEVWLDK